jgi:hypothetical protein
VVGAAVVGWVGMYAALRPRVKKISLLKFLSRKRQP